MQAFSKLVVAACFVGVSALDDNDAFESSSQLLLDAGFRSKLIKEKALSMSSEEAMAKLEKKRSEEEMAPVTDVMSALQENQKKKYTLDIPLVIRAVQNLNDMYLEDEKELDETIFECTSTRRIMKTAMDKTEAQVAMIGSGIDDTSGGLLKFTAEKAEGEQNIDVLDTEHDEAKRKMEEIKKADEKREAELQATFDVMSFMLEVAQCKEPKKALLLAQKNSADSEDATVMQCKQQDDEYGSYLVNMFADPEMQKRVETLSPEAQKRVSSILGEASEGSDAEELSDSFIQKSMSTQAPRLGGPNACSGLKPDCAIMTDKVGGMYGDARDELEEHQAEMKKKADAWDVVVADYNAEHEHNTAAVTFAQGQINDLNKHKGTLEEEKEAANLRFKEEEKELKKYWDECKNTVNKIMTDGVCAIRNVRRNILDTANGMVDGKPDKTKDVTGVAPDDLSGKWDCEMSEWRPKGECSHSCVNRKTRPSAEVMNRLAASHVQKWEREPTIAPDDKYSSPDKAKKRNRFFKI